MRRRSLLTFSLLAVLPSILISCGSGRIKLGAAAGSPAAPIAPAAAALYDDPALPDRERAPAGWSRLDGCFGPRSPGARCP